MRFWLRFAKPFLAKIQISNKLVAFPTRYSQIITLTKQEGGFPGGETSIGSEFLLENDELVENFVELGL